MILTLPWTRAVLGAYCACVLIGLIQTQSPRLILKNLMLGQDLN